MAVAELLDHESYLLKTTGREQAGQVAKRIRLLADIIEGKV